MSISNYGEKAFLDALYNNAAVQIAARYVKLHVGDPGDDCVDNPAMETQRQPLDDAPAVSPNGTFASVNDLIWANVAATEHYRFVSIWDDQSAGNPWWSGPLTANPITAGETFVIPAGSLIVTLA